ncbi:hypothetical protein WISP_21621 [Willisornis vidua]|uniref:Protein FMC1 homolog n=1 Tax=Willisornis vidua TaxID=1566151 RepID=A0ABQ9DNL5_9PASS|nr:hypothetical protein WISP_21621 [Willisornis vidua]
MAALGAPLRTLRALLRELRLAAGRHYRDSPAYRHVLAAFRAHRVRAGPPPTAPCPALPEQPRRWAGPRGRPDRRSPQVTSEKLCRAQQELHFQAATYLCLLRSVRQHEALHREYHGKGERSPEEVAGLVGFRLPQQPGGKG